MADLERERALERERTRIARDLHDDLGSRLSHIAIMADGIAPPSIATVDAQARDAPSQTMDELVWAVNARQRHRRELRLLRRAVRRRARAAAGLRCRLQLPPDLRAPRLAADARRHLYLAVKEAINNAVKHARASEIQLSRRASTRGALVVEVADDGRGLPAQRDPTGNGLTNFRERMDARRRHGRGGVGARAGHGSW